MADSARDRNVKFIDQNGEAFGIEHINGRIRVISSGLDPDDNPQSFKIDEEGGALVTIQQVHHYIHLGKSFLSVYSAVKNNAQTIEVRFQTPDTAMDFHMTIQIEGALAGTAEMWVDTTKTDDPNNRLTPFNHNLRSSISSTLIICHTPSGAQVGDADLIQYFGSTSANGKVTIGGATNSRGEFILKQNSAYYIKVTSRADANALSIILDWYEH